MIKGKKNKKCGHNQDLEIKKTTLLESSCQWIPFPDASTFFDTDGTTYGRVYGMAEAIRRVMQESSGRPICVASKERSVLAAAVLASLSGCSPIIIPYGISRRILAEAEETTGFDHVVTGAVEKNCAPENAAVMRMHAGDHFAGEPPRPSGDPNKPFVYLYTGGSTGKPKLWAKSRANLFGESEFLVRKFGLDQDDVIVSTVPALHIYGLLFTVTVVMAAGCRIAARQPFMPAEVEEMLADESTTVFVSGPAHYRLLRDLEIRSPGLRLAFSSGGMLGLRDGVHFHAKTGIGITEVYGSTETGGIACRCAAEGEKEWTVFPDVRWTTRPVEAGEELLVDSPFLSSGLLLKEGFFSTGDIVIPKDRDRFLLVGRGDGIVKVGGKRVDLLEVEQKIRAIDGVKDCHVSARPRADGRSVEIVALVSGPVGSGKIRRLLGECISPLAMPRRIICVKDIPTTSTGKRDGRAIKKLISDEPISVHRTHNQE